MYRRLFILFIAITTCLCDDLVAAGRLSDYEKQIVASTLVMEAASDGQAGMQAVLNVIYNRADGRIERVIRVTVRRGQFSCLNRVTRHKNPNYSPFLRRAQRDPMYPVAYKLVMMLERGLLNDITSGACYYHTTSTRPKWSGNKRHLVTIGRHRFYQCSS